MYERLGFDPFPGTEVQREYKTISFILFKHRVIETFINRNYIYFIHNKKILCNRNIYLGAKNYKKKKTYSSALNTNTKIYFSLILYVL